MSEQLLRLDHITMQFGGVVAVDDLELEVNVKCTPCQGQF